MPVAYSYARFSSSKQEKGSSLDRQKNLAIDYAARHGLVLDQTRYTDLGVSAFRGKNAAHGALSVFLKAAEAGKIAAGSILLVEEFSRLSRAIPWDAFKVFQRIIDLGIVLITLEDGFSYSIDILKKEPHKIFIVHGHLIANHATSATKRAYALAKIADREKKGQLPTTRVSSWMKFAADRKSALLIPARAKIIKEIFDRTIDGIGAREITRDLNARKVPTPTYAKEWRQSALSQLLHNPAVYGEFKGEIRYPAVITKARFLRAQKIIRDRTLYRGGYRRRNPNNSLVGLAKCGKCGRAMRFLPRTDGTLYMHCVGSADHGTCDARRFPFVPCETALVVHLTVLETNQGLTRSIYAEKHEQATILEAEIGSLQSKIDRLIEIGEASGDTTEIGLKVKRHREKRDKLRQQLNELGIGAEDNGDSVEIFSEYSKRIHRGEGDVLEVRRKLHMAFMQVLSKVEFVNAKEKKWLPTLRLTYVNGRTATVDVMPFLAERTKLWIKNGTYRPVRDSKKR